MSDLIGEDVLFGHTEKIQEAVRLMVEFNKAEYELSAGLVNQLPESGPPEIVFSGRSNVGKSSLINKLVNRKALARTSSKPGKTVTINFFKVGDVRFIDLPGYGYAQVSFSEKKRWAALVDGYLCAQRNVALVIQIVDMRHSPSVQDMQMINFLYKMHIPFVIVATKCDKLNATRRRQRESDLDIELEEYKGVKKIFVSSVKGEGIDEVKDFIVKSVDSPFVQDVNKNADD